MQACPLVDTGYPSNCRMLTDGRWKYIWRPHDGSEQLFDLQKDPDEIVDWSSQEPATLELMRSRMIETLKNRPEGFVQNGKLIPARPYPGLLPNAGNG